MTGDAVGEYRGVAYRNTELWNAFKRITSGASAAEKRALCSGSAVRVYRITVP
jgi:hypothetical protein